jgi:spore coat protein CotH
VHIDGVNCVPDRKARPVHRRSLQNRWKSELSTAYPWRAILEGPRDPMHHWLTTTLAALTACAVSATVGCSSSRESTCPQRGAACQKDAAPDSPGTPDAPGTGDPGGLLAEPDDLARYLFDPNELRTYNLIVAETDLAIIDANPAAERTVPGMLEFEGQQYGPVGVRYKGSVGAFNPPCMDMRGGRGGPKTGKCSMKVAFDYLDEEARFFGLKKLNFHAMNRDASLLRDRLGYSLFREMGIAAPRSVHARLLINGRLEGLFALVEQIDGRFTRSRFTEGGKGNLYKEVWPIHDVESRYVAALETNRDENPSVERMLAFKHAIDEGSESILHWLDRDYMLRFIAVDRVTINDDGAFHFRCVRAGDGTAAGSNHNYYWYEAADARRFWLLPWDLDNNFDNRASVHIASEWSAVTDCRCAGFGQLAPACDPLIHHWTTWRADYERVVDDFLASAFSAANVDTKLAGWIAQIEAAVEESAGLKGAPTVDAWRGGVTELRGKIEMARAHRGYPY